jgi:hypothetical protein
MTQSGPGCEAIICLLTHCLYDDRGERPRLGLWQIPGSVPAPALEDVMVWFYRRIICHEPHIVSIAWPVHSRSLLSMSGGLPLTITPYSIPAS